MSKAERRAKKEKNKQFKESSFMYPKEETFKFQHSKPVPLEELLGNVRLLKKPRLVSSFFQFKNILEMLMKGYSLRLWE